MALIQISIGFKLLTLIFILGFLRGTTSSRLPFSSAEININVPKPIGDLLGSVPGFLSSFLNTNKHHGASQETLQHSVGPVSLNFNIEQPNQHHHQQSYQYTSAGSYQYTIPNLNQQNNYNAHQYTADNYQYMTPNLNLQQNDYNAHQYYYYPPHQPGYNGHGYYPYALPQPPPQAPQYTTNQPNWNVYLPQPGLTQPNPNNTPINPSEDQNPYMPTYETTIMPPLAQFEDVNKPILRAPSPYRAKPGPVIFPDSPLYVNIPEEPTMYGIIPRR